MSSGMACRTKTMTEAVAMSVSAMPAQALRRHAFTLLRLWHAVFAGGFLVAYLTADEDTYAMHRSEEHTSELQSLMRISYAVFCLKKKKNAYINYTSDTHKCKIQNPITNTTKPQSVSYR